MENNMIKFIKTAFCSNYWIWFHILAGGLIAKLLFVFTTFTKVDIIVVVLGMALIWESIEYFIELNTNVEKVYGSKEHWIYDTIGDVLGALMCTLIVIC